jgi:hypothetical protein
MKKIRWTSQKDRRKDLTQDSGLLKRFFTSISREWHVFANTTPLSTLLTWQKYWGFIFPVIFESAILPQTVLRCFLNILMYQLKYLVWQIDSTSEYGCSACQLCLWSHKIKCVKMTVTRPIKIIKTLTNCLVDYLKNHLTSRQKEHKIGHNISSSPYRLRCKVFTHTYMKMNKEV